MKKQNGLITQNPNVCVSVIFMNENENENGKDQQFVHENKN